MLAGRLERGLFVAAAAVMAYFVVPPLLILFLTSIEATRGLQVTGLTFAHYENVLSTGGAAASLVGNTLVFGLGSAALGLAAGVALAWLVERTDCPFKGAIYIAAFFSFAIPGVVKVIGWILLLGPRAGAMNLALRTVVPVETGPLDVFSMGGMILVESLIWTPVVFLVMAAPLRSMDPSLEEAAAMAGAGLWGRLRSVTLALAWPSILSLLILTLIRSLVSFDVPALIGVPADIAVLTTRIYNEIRTGLVPQYGEASAYASILTVFVLLLLIPYARLIRRANRYATITGKAYRPRLYELGRWRGFAGACALLFPVLVGLPIAMLLWASLLRFYQPPTAEALAFLTLDNYPSALRNGDIIAALRNTLVVSILSAVAVMALSFVAAWVVLRSRVPRRGLLDQLSSLPLVFPGVVLGIAVLRTYLTLPVPIFGTVLLLVAAYIPAYMAYGMRFAEAGLIQIHRELEESGLVHGGTFLSVARTILVPLMLPALFGGFVYVFLLSAKEFSIAALLYGPQSRVASVAIWELWQNGQISQLAAFCLMVAGALVALSLVFRGLSRRYGVAA